MSGPDGGRLLVELVPAGPKRWEARGGLLGTGYGSTVIGALEDLLEAMKLDAERAVDEALERARSGDAEPE